MDKDEALKLVRDWIAERPADRPVSAGKMISIIDRALAQSAQKREWVGLTDGEITEGLCRTKYAVLTAVAWVDGVEWATKQLKEKNSE